MALKKHSSPWLLSGSPRSEFKALVKSTPDLTWREVGIWENCGRSAIGFGRVILMRMPREPDASPQGALASIARTSPR
jgi:hypothetical protein